MRPTLATLRATARRRLTETGTITRPGTGQPIFDNDTGEYINPPPTVVFGGPMLVRPQDRSERVVESGEATVTLTRYDVTVPAGTDVRRGDTAILTAAPYDPALVGIRLFVLDVPLDAWQVARVVTAQRAT